MTRMLKPEFEKKSRVSFPIGWKLMTMMSLILAAGMTSVVYLATNAYLVDSLAFIQKSEADSSRQLANQVEDYLRLMNKQMIRTAKVVEGQQSSRLSSLGSAPWPMLLQSSELLTFALWEPEKKQPLKLEFSTTLAHKPGANIDLHPDPRSFTGQPSMQKMQVEAKVFFLLSLPVEQTVDGHITRVASALIDPEPVLAVFKKQGVALSYLVSQSGEVLAHPATDGWPEGKSYADEPVVKTMFASQVLNGQGEFDQGGQAYLGAYKKIAGWNMGVVSLVPKEVATATVQRVKVQAFWVTGIVLFLSLMIIYFFSTTLTNPIQKLVRLSRKIAEGNFAIEIKHSGHDEVALLTKSFAEMAKGLAERERIKGLFSKFHSKEIAEKILREELSLGGSRHDATVLFCDVRDFTGISEKSSATEVVEMLNEYFGVLVSQISEHRGIVDKFIGDAIMAVWGAPITNPDHAFHAVQGALAMRAALKELNLKREARGQHLIRMGIGIHSGELISGNIGSVDRMEHTVIGDTVNTASRLESVTKKIGTDLIISDAVLQRCKGRLITQAFPATDLKGKTGEIQIHGVIGYIDEQGKEILPAA